MNTALVLTAVAAIVTPNLQSVLDQIRIAQDVPGVSAVVTRGDEILFAGASGVADLESGRNMTPDTVLYAGSLTKILTAVLTLQLVEQGNLTLDAIVSGIAIRSNRKYRPVNVRDLLTHTSGLDREGNFNYWFNAQFPDKKALVTYLRETRLNARPGASVRYSNIGYAALGLAVEESAGRSYEDALSSRVLKPLGMHLSGTNGPGPNLSGGYSPANRVLPNKDRPFAGLGRRVGNRTVREYHNAKAMAPAFGAFTTAHDLSRLARFLLGYAGDEVLSGEMRSQFLTAQEGVRGLGIRLAKYKGRPVARHGGWFAAHQSHILLDLESDIGVVVLTNSDSASPGKIAEALLGSALKSARADSQ